MSGNSLPGLFAIGWFMRALVDLDLRRELPVAVALAVLLLITLPRGRRGLVATPLGLILLAAVPFALVPLFPQSPEAAIQAAYAARFLLLASLLVSLLRIATVSVWERFRSPLPRIVLDVIGSLLVGLALLTVLYEAGIEARNLFTGSAVITAVLGFALKDTLGNVFAGLSIHAEHPFQVGDWIQYDPVTAHIGKVVEINWRATKVLTLDEAYVIIPNAQLAQASIRNFTQPDPWSRRSLFVVTPYDVPPQRVQEIILEAITGSFGVLKHPAPSVVTNAFTERGVEHWVRLFTTEFDKRDRVDGMARDRIWYALSRHGIRIPVATHAVQLSEPSAPEPPAAATARRAACLGRLGVLEAMRPELVTRLASACSDRVYAAGEQVVRQGAVGASMFVVMTGSLEVTAVSDDAEAAARLATLRAGDYFGEMSLMTGAPRVATVTAVEETRLLEVGKEAFAAILAEEPGLLDALSRSLQRRMVERAQLLAAADRPPPEVQDVLRKIRDFFAV